MKPSLVFNPPVIGHRGACAYAPENTMASFIKAAQLDLKWVEFDVMNSEDNVPVIFHDDKLNRTTNGKGLLNQHPFSYLQSLDAGKWFDPAFSGERIPTLMEVISFLADAKISANVEIKCLHDQEEKLIKRVLEEMSDYLQHANQDYIFSSFSFDALRLLRQYSPDCQLGLLLHDWEKNWRETAKQLNCISIHVNHNIMTQALANEIKAMDKYLLCYTVNHPDRARELFGWGVDAVFSDAPDKVI